MSSKFRWSEVTTEILFNCEAEYWIPEFERTAVESGLKWKEGNQECCGTNSSSTFY